MEFKVGCFGLLVIVPVPGDGIGGVGIICTVQNSSCPAVYRDLFI